MHYESVIQTPIGNLLVKEASGSIYQTTFTDRSPIASTSPLLKKFTNQMNRYFLGKLYDFDLSLCVFGTDLVMDICNEISYISYGETVSCTDIALRVGDSKRAGLVGKVVRSNYLAILIPTHRVNLHIRPRKEDEYLRQLETKYKARKHWLK